MKKKVKRYQTGGRTEEDYKREGLASSKDDKVGFFERLRMGNIDNPSSEAYRRFGAGRAKMAEEARTPVPEMSSDYSGRGARSMESSQRFPRDDAGIESRRQTSDYSSESSDTSPSMAERLSAASSGSNIRRMDGEGSYTSPLKETMEEEVKPKPKPKPKPRKRVSQSFGVDEAGIAERSKAAKSDTPYGKSERLKALMESFSPERSSKRYAESTPYARSKMGMKSGGKVSSASSRADGIAQRGKTKGRIC